MSNKRLANVSSKQVILEIKIYTYCMLVSIHPSSVFYSNRAILFDRTYFETFESTLVLKKTEKFQNIAN